MSVVARVSRWVGPVEILLPADQRSAVSCSRVMLMQSAKTLPPGLEVTARSVGLVDLKAALLHPLRLVAVVADPTPKLHTVAGRVAQLVLTVMILIGLWLKGQDLAPLASPSCHL
jgi:uncharacterized membrane protein